MNKKVLSLGVMLSLATTGVMAADSVTTSVNNGDQLTKYQKEAIQLTQKQLAEKAVQDSKTYEHALALDETRTIDLALANNRTAKQTKWDYQAAKDTVSATAASKNPSISYSWQGSRSKGVNAMTGRNVTTKTGSHSFTISAPVFSPEIDASIDASRYAREGTGAAYEEALQQAKYDAISGYYTLIMNRNLVDVAQQAVKDYQGHVTNVDAQYNVGLVASSDVLAAKTNLADSETNLVKAQNTANLAEASLNQVIAYPVQTSITTAERDLQYKPYNVTLEQAKAYAMLHRSALVKSAMAVKEAESALRKSKFGYLPTVGVEAGRGYADFDGYFGTSNKSWHIGAKASWSLWDGGATQNKVKVASDTLEKAKEANLAAVDSVLLSVQKAYLNLRSAEQTIQSTQTAVTQGQESFRIATLRYRAGVGTNLDVLDAEIKLTTARNNYVQALYNYNISIAALEQLTGVPLNTPVGQGAEVIANSGAIEQLAKLGSNQ
ncbi:MAG: TolC family protein [Veillonella sp.]|uniref:TolC family protein n=1 Tax=Veillonella sp. TaxID=1926307 RepID=UPI0029131085|nr:TolC family protein [Veillonella sp.]MDU7910300.1 TolC family protein [Veillonella parvula]MDU7928423.1 TolC family protein [Veillonella sp.]